MRLRISLLMMAVLLLAGGVVAVAAEEATTTPAAASGDPEPAADPAVGGSAEPPADTPPEPAHPPAREDLPERLAALVADPGMQARTVGVSVTAADGAPVFGHGADALLVPASTQKLVVAAGALASLGADFRYETVLAGTASPDPDGVLHGDLVLVGSGDPALGTPTYGGVVPERPRTPMESLVDQVVAAGVTRVTGSVLGDPRVFPHQPQASGWLPRYLAKGNTALSSGLTAEGGRRLFHEGGRLRSEPSADPASTAAVSLHKLLSARGVVIDRSAGSTTAPPDAPVRLASVTSPPLRDLLRYTVQRSDNHLADAIFRTVGLAAGDATWEGSAAAVRQSLDVLGLDWTGIVLADGSGLSRSDRLSPSFLTQLDAAMARSTAARHWRPLMAVAGESGTLRRRLVGSVAERRLIGKTGSLKDVGSLSGTVVGPDGARYHFAVVGNDLDAAGKQAVRRLQDRVVLALAEELYDCKLEPVEAVPEGAPVPPDAALELACAA